MGIGLWAFSGLLAFLLTRIARFGRPRGWVLELVASLVAAGVAGLTATALDFGGLKIADPRAGLFAFFLALAATGFLRWMRVRKS